MVTLPSFLLRCWLIFLAPYPMPLSASRSAIVPLVGQASAWSVPFHNSANFPPAPLRDMFTQLTLLYHPLA